MGTVYYLAFGYTDKWYNRFLPGFTHVALIMPIDGGYIGIEPALRRCHISCGVDFNHKEWAEVLKVEVISLKANRLIGVKFQTCATFVQYIIGISTGSYLCQTLYERLTNRVYTGVEVTKWNTQTNC